MMIIEAHRGQPSVRRIGGYSLAGVTLPPDSRDAHLWRILHHLPVRNTGAIEHSLVSEAMLVNLVLCPPRYAHNEVYISTHVHDLQGPTSLPRGYTPHPTPQLPSPSRFKCGGIVKDDGCRSFVFCSLKPTCLDRSHRAGTERDGNSLGRLESHVRS